MKKSRQKRNNISDRVRNINYSVIRKAFSGGSKKGIINLTIGQPDFETPDYLKVAAQRAIEQGYNKYTETKGLLDLRQAISKKLFSEKVARTEEEIIITAGTTSAIFMTLFSLINPDDEVVVFSPYFIAYLEIINFLGGRAKIVKTDRNFQPDISKLKKTISNRTKAIIINSPNNPTGVVYQKEAIKQIVQIAEKNDLYIISDEIYSSLVFGETTCFSPAKIYKKTVVINGLSKSNAVTGWRIGFIAGPKQIVDAVEKIQQYTTVCAPSVFQYAAVEAINKPINKKIIDSYQKRRDLIYQNLKNSFEIIKPDGAFYFFIKINVSGTSFANLLLEKGVAVVAGEAFGKDFKNYFRISFAVSEEQINKSVTILKEVATLLR
mgnify:CR=1 FL=1